MPSLLLVNYEYPPLGGGAGNATRYIGRHLARAGCRVAVLTTRYRGQSAVEDDEGVRVHRVAALRRALDHSNPVEMLSFTLAAASRVRSIARQEETDFSLAFMALPSGPVSWWLKRTRGIPYLVSLRGGDVPGFLPEQLGAYHRLAGPAIRRVCGRAASVVANSEGLCRVARAGLPGIDVGVIPNGVDAERFHPGPFRALPEPVRILFVGRLSAQKDLPTLLRAAAGACSSLPLEIVLCGDGPARAALERQAAGPPGGPAVRFLGWRDRAELPELYRSADLFVLPSVDEGMANVLLEAMASGLAVVATRVSGSDELVRDGENGLLCSPGDVDQLRECIVRLAQDPGLRCRLGTAARADACRRGWDQVARAYLERIEGCLGASAGR